MKQTVINYIKSLTSFEKEKLKVMLKHNIVCGSGFAKFHNLDIVKFNNELKLILEV